MAVKIRLRRIGAKKAPVYRVVVAADHAFAAGTLFEKTPFVFGKKEHFFGGFKQIIARIFPDFVKKFLFCHKFRL